MMSVAAPPPKSTRGARGRGSRGARGAREGNNGCQMAIAKFLDFRHLALGASGLWLCYSTLQNLIPSVPWIASPPSNPAQSRKGRDQTLPSGNLGAYRGSTSAATSSSSRSSRGGSRGRPAKNPVVMSQSSIKNAFAKQGSNCCMIGLI